MPEVVVQSCSTSSYRGLWDPRVTGVSETQSPHLHVFRTFEWNTLIQPITVSRWGFLSVELP